MKYPPKKLYLTNIPKNMKLKGKVEGVDDSNFKIGSDEASTSKLSETVLAPKRLLKDLKDKQVK